MKTERVDLLNARTALLLKKVGDTLQEATLDALMLIRDQNEIIAALQEQIRQLKGEL